MARGKEYAFKFDLRTKGGKAAAQMFGQMAKAQEQLARSSHLTAQASSKLTRKMMTLAKSIDSAKRGARQAGKSITDIASHTNISRLHDLANMFDFVGQRSLNVSKAIMRGFSGVYGQLFDIGTSFEYIKGGLDFAFGRKSQAVMRDALNIAQETNISTREVLDVTRSLGVLKINPFSEMVTKKGEIQSSLKSLSDLATLVPQQGMQGALFAIRNALSGQWRSLQMRFDIPLNIIDEIRARIDKTMSTQQRFNVIMQGITDKFGGLMKSVEHTARFALDNIKDVMTNLAYDVFRKSIEEMTPYFQQIFSYLKAFRRDKESVQAIAKVFTGMTESIMVLAKYFLSIAKTLVNIVKLHPQIVKYVTLFGALALGVSSLTGGIAVSLGLLTRMRALLGSVGVTARVAQASVTGLGVALRFAGVVGALALVGAGIYKIYLMIKKSREETDKLVSIARGYQTEEYTSIATQLREGARQLKEYTEVGGKGTLFEGMPAKSPETKEAYEKIHQYIQTQLIGKRISKFAAEKMYRDVGLYKYLEETTGEKGEKRVILGEAWQKGKLTVGKGGLEVMPITAKRVSALRESMITSAQQLEALRTLPGGILETEQQKQWNREYTEWKTSVLDQIRERRRKAAEMVLGRKGTATERALAIKNLMSYIRGEKSFKKLAGEPGAPYAGMAEAKISGASEILKGTLTGKIKGQGLLQSKLLMPFMTGEEGGASIANMILGEAGKELTPEQWVKEIYRHGIRIGGAELPGIPSGTQKLTAAQNKFLEKQIQQRGAPELIKEALSTKSKDTEFLVENITRLFGNHAKLMEEGNENTEETANNTRKTQELLPPIFREIFDEFTRRTMMTQMGGNVFASRLAGGV